MTIRFVLMVNNQGQTRLAQYYEYLTEQQDERGEVKWIEQEHNELKNEMAQYADNDPDAIEAMKNAVEVAHSAANRWTDNIFTLRQWCSNYFPEAKEQLENLV